MSDDSKELVYAPTLRYQTLNCRSFWRAGSDDTFAPTIYLSDGKLESSEFERARVHPKFLHSNATSHKWAFGAIAELLDNAVDEISNGATLVKVDRVFNSRDNSPALLFQDDGGGMDPQKIRQCMSLGFSSKITPKTIGRYGNGFKTSTMRLGADVIVFSCSKNKGCCTRSIGLLSYTFLTKTNKNDIIVPVVDFEVVDDKAGAIVFGSAHDWDCNMRTILDWSPYSSIEELLSQFQGIEDHGTKVVVYNLWYDDDDRLELDFDTNAEDIQLRERATMGNFSQASNNVIESHISFNYRYSLRAYVSILYLKKFASFSIVLRGAPVQHLSIAGELKFLKVAYYRPYVGKDEAIKLKIGFAKEAPALGMYGFNIYHRNRLVMPFWKVFQEGSNRGKCVIGVLEANFIEPAHDKQDFERSTLFNRLEIKLKHMITEYWKTHCHLIGYKSAFMEGLANKHLKKACHEPQTSATEPNMKDPNHSPQPFHINGSVDLQTASAAQSEAGFTLSHKKVPPQLLTGHVVSNGSIASEINIQEHQFPRDEHGFAREDDMHMLQDVSSLAQTVDLLDSDSIDALGRENVRLLLKREQHQGRLAELKHQIEMLEEELREVRTKCADLACKVEAQKLRIVYK